MKKQVPNGFKIFLGVVSKMYEHDFFFNIYIAEINISYIYVQNGLNKVLNALKMGLLTK